LLPNPEAGFVTLPEVVTGELARKFSEISLFDQHADFELESASNSNSTFIVGYRVRAGYSTIACGPPTLRALHAWPPQPLQGPHGGSLRTPGWQGARTRVQLGLRHRPRPRFGLQHPLRLLLGLRVGVRLRVGR
jgi:hypothetical protein